MIRTPDLFLIFNHEITPRQEQDARSSLNVGQNVDLLSDLKDMWQSVPPELPKIADYLEPVKKWLGDNAAPADYVLVQGDFGATFMMVNFALSNRLVPVYSTTAREAVQKKS